jgi:hypothetical protein
MVKLLGAAELPLGHPKDGGVKVAEDGAVAEEGHNLAATFVHVHRGQPPGLLLSTAEFLA